jgi:glycosyltransferase involved in cell wall biosynthesis
MWSAWRSEGSGAAVLTGASGIGKSEKVIRPLVVRAAQDGVRAVWIEVPPYSTNLDAALVARMVEGLGEADDPSLAAIIPAEANFATAARKLLVSGFLVVVDDFQLLLDTGGRPLSFVAEVVGKLARRPPDSGCLWLVSNQRVDPTWTEPFHVVELPPPEENDAIAIVIANIGAGDIDARFPFARRTEVVRRLGANPRVLRLLGLLLQDYTLEELLPPADILPDEPLEPAFVDHIEKMLIEKAAVGLPNEAREFLRDLSIVRDRAPWGLLEAIGEGKRNIREQAGWLRRRYLLHVFPDQGRPEPVPNPRYQVHPLVREVKGVQLRSDEGAWRAAHRRAGEWYAESARVAGSGPNRDYTLATALDGAQFHLTEAAAEATLAEALRPVRGYVERRYGWTTPRVVFDGERNGRIALLEAYHRVSGTAGTHYHLARLLRDRSRPGDLAEALRQAERSTDKQDHSDPWVLWLQLVCAVEGIDAAVAAARVAAGHVAPAKNLYCVYQLLGAYLGIQGHADEAVYILREGAQRAEWGAFKLAEEAVFCAAAEPADDLLEGVCDWLSQSGEHEPQFVLAEALMLQRHNRWREAAELIGRNLSLLPTYLMFTLHHALGWLGADEPSRAQEALYNAAIRLRPVPALGTAWLASFVALQANRLPEASQYLRKHLGTPTAPTTADEIRALLLHDWDHRVATPGKSNPALVHPVLPPALTGLSAVSVRSQHGGPVLAEHRPGGSESLPHDQLRVLVLATEWWSAHGGLSTFNRRLCAALAAGGTRVSCVVPHATQGELQDAAASGIRLVEALHTPGASSDLERLSRKPLLADGDEPDVIIGHGRITGPAVHHLGDDFPQARRLHFIHVIPDDIELYKLDRDEDFGKVAEERQEIELALSSDADKAVAVGPRIYNWFLRDLKARNVSESKIVRFDPGFDFEDDESRVPPLGAPWMVLLLGRAEDSRIKGLDLAAQAFTRARQRLIGEQAVQLRVRGVPEGTSEAFAEKMRDWAQDRSLPLQVRPYSADMERLAADLRAASLVLMPSRAEGFGLVGVEAITAGTPVLVSTASGLGEILEELLEPHETAHVVVRTVGDDAQDIEEWSRAIEAVLRDRETAFTRAAELRRRMASQRSWSGEVSKLLTSLDAYPANSEPEGGAMKPPRHSAA